MSKVINISIPDELVEQVNRQAQAEDRPRSAIFREALQLYFAVRRRPAVRGRTARAEPVLRENVAALNRLALEQGLTEDELLRIGAEVREQIFRERYAAKR